MDFKKEFSTVAKRFGLVQGILLLEMTILTRTNIIIIKQSNLGKYPKIYYIASLPKAFIITSFHYAVTINHSSSIKQESPWGRIPILVNMINKFQTLI